MTEGQEGAPPAGQGDAAIGSGKPAPSFRAWALAILVAAILSVGATLLLGGGFRGESRPAANRSGCGGGCCGDAGK